MAKATEHAIRQALDAIESGASFDYLDNVVAPRLRAALKLISMLEDENDDSLHVSYLLGYSEGSEAERSRTTKLVHELCTSNDNAKVIAEAIQRRVGG